MREYKGLQWRGRKIPKRKSAVRKNDFPNSNKPLTPEDYRAVMDLALLGHGWDYICRELGRNYKSVRQVYDHVLRNYQLTPTSTPALNRLKLAKSVLVYDRLPTPADRAVFRNASLRGLDDLQIAIILHVPEATVRYLRRDLGTTRAQNSKGFGLSTAKKQPPEVRK